MLDEWKVQMAGVRFGVCSFGVGRFAVGFVVIAGTEWGMRQGWLTVCSRGVW